MTESVEFRKNLALSAQAPRGFKALGGANLRAFRAAGMRNRRPKPSSLRPRFTRNPQRGEKDLRGLIIMHVSGVPGD